MALQTKPSELSADLSGVTADMGEQNGVRVVDTVGLVGLGLMGRGIAACLLSHGLRVVAFNRTAERARKARVFIADAMDEVVRRGVAEESAVADWSERFTIVSAIDGLAGCPFAIESVKEEIELKRDLFSQLEACLDADAVIASNTSSFPLTMLQSESQHPERFVVMHWSEPAWITRFMEIVRNEVTSESAVATTKGLGLACGKEPSFLNFDVRGFVANRLMYAFMREACYLADIGVADVATIDRSFRNLPSLVSRECSRSQLSLVVRIEMLIQFARVESIPGIQL